jgi:putative lipoprotein
LNRLILFLLLALTLAGGCCTPDRREQGPSLPAEAMTDVFSWVFACDDMVFSARFHPEEAVLDLGRRMVTLSQVKTASGARYESGDGRVSFWNKGREAFLESGGGIVRDCMSVPAADPWEDAALRGVTLRAVGHEPGWDLEISEDHWLRLRYDYGREVVYTTTLESAATDAGRNFYYATGESIDLRIEVERTPCVDIMSGEKMSLRVNVNMADRRLSGCGHLLQ